MRGLWVVARREMAARRMVVPVALGLGLLPFVATLLFDGKLAYEAAMDAWFAGWCLALAAAFYVGVSLLGPELHGGQLRFHFTRPISGWQIFAGKTLGGAVVVIVVAILLVSPAGWLLRHWPDYLGVRHSPEGEWVGPFGNLAGDARLLLLCLALGLAFGVALRSRSRWLLVDLAGMTLLVVAALRFLDRTSFLTDHRFRKVWNPFFQNWDPLVVRARLDFLDRVETVVVAATVAAAVALLAAGAAAVVFGRTDRRRARAALSATLWPIAVPAAGVMVACAQWWL